MKILLMFTQMIIYGDYTSFLIFVATYSNESGLQTRNARHENKAGQTAGTSEQLYWLACMSWVVTFQMNFVVQVLA